MQQRIDFIVNWSSKSTDLNPIEHTIWIDVCVDVRIRLPTSSYFNIAVAGYTPICEAAALQMNNVYVSLIQGISQYPQMFSI